MKNLCLTVSPRQAGQRLDRVLCAAAPHLSRAVLQKAVQAGACAVDGVTEVRCNAKTRIGQVIRMDLPTAESTLRAEQGHLDILWQDGHLAVCNKPAGLTVHPCPSCPEKTLVQRLLGYFPQLGQQEGLRPGIVHRLDKDTSGLLVVALTGQDRLALSAAFARRAVGKEYLALVAGKPLAEGRCQEPLGRHPAARVKMAVVPESRGGRQADTRWRTLWTAPDERFSLLAVRILTGRTHQIRVHLAHVGHPLLGDSLYAPKSVRDMAPRQMLHAWRLAFAHPRTGENLCFSCPPPADMPEAALAAARRMQRVVITGNPGSGKSALTRCLARREVPVVSADAVVRDLYAPGGEGSRWLAGVGRRDLLSPRGDVCRPALLDAMRQNPDLRRDLERAVHAMTREVVEDFWRREEEKGFPLAVAEIPLYFESGWDAAFAPKPLAVGVRCSQDMRARRLGENRGWDEEKIAALESWQWPEDRKLRACDLVVDNSGSPDALQGAADRLLAVLEQKRAQARQDMACELAALWAQGRKIRHN